MAKGDSSRVRNAIDQENSYLGSRLENLRFGMAEPLFNQSMADYGQARGMNLADYGNLMGGFKNFAETGGFTPEDLADFRARAVAPIRSAYAGANREVDRARALSGGSMPGYAVLKARMARDSSQGMSDASINANAAIADMVQRGKLSGLQGGSNLYGTTPGWSSLASSNLFRAGDLNMDLLRTDLSRGLGILGQRNQAAGIPGKWQQTYDNILKGGQMVAGAAAPWAGGA